MLDKTNHDWASRITRESKALDLQESGFTWFDPKRIAPSLQRSAERSTGRKAADLRSATSMLVFCINRGGRTLDPEQKEIMEQVKDELRNFYGRLPRT